MFDAVSLSKYGGVVATLVLSGFGLPIPEEIPVVTAGAMVGHDAQEVADYDRLAGEYEAFDRAADAAGAVAGGAVEHLRPARPEVPAHLTRWWVMLPLVIAGAVLSDAVIYGGGRLFGRRLLKSGWVRRNILPPDKQAKIEANFHKNGIMILLGARFTPGIRTPVFLMAGVLKMPLSRFLLADALYAIPGINLLFWLAYVFTDRFVNAVTTAAHAVERHRSMVIVAVLAFVAGMLVHRFVTTRRLSTGDVDAIPPMAKPVGAVANAVEQGIEKAVGATVQATAKVVDKVVHPLGAHGKPLPGAGGLPVVDVPDATAEPVGNEVPAPAAADPAADPPAGPGGR